MNNQITTFDLTEFTKNELAVKGYITHAKSTIYATLRQLNKFSHDIGEKHYTPEIAVRFLKDEWGYPVAEGETPKWRKSTIAYKVRTIERLNWVYQYGCLPQKGTPLIAPLPPHYAELTEMYSVWQVKKNFAANTIISQNRTCLSFIKFLIDCKISNVNEIDGSNISDYVITLRGHAPATMRGDLGRLRNFLKFLYLHDKTAKNMAEFVPSFQYGNVVTVETHIWSKEELNQLLRSIDRNSPVGKRDYAVCLLAIELGMRNSDITALKLDDIHWEPPCHIEFTQSKTKYALTLPLPEKVGLAIIDYLKYGRPKTECQNVFVRHIAPYDALHGFSGIFHKRVAQAGIPKRYNRKYGLHSMRHTVATRMLESGVGFDLIAPFLGHADESTLHVYINSDIEHLRQCALSFEPGAAI